MKTENTLYTAPALITLAEETEQKDFNYIEILRELDEHRHAVYGVMKITGAMLAEMKNNFDAGVRRLFDADGKPTLDIDYDHKKSAQGGKAAGWIKALKLVERTLTNGKKIVSLWAKPEWNTDAQVAIKNGDYKYFSAEFQSEYKEPEQDKTYKNVLLGGGITNRPYVKELAPLTLTETVIETAQISKEDTMIDSLKEIAVKCGVQLTETVTETEVIKALGEKIDADAAVISDNTKVLAEITVKLSEAEKLLAEVNAEKEKIKLAADEARKGVILAEAQTKLTPAEQKELLEPLFAEGKFEYAEKLVSVMPVKLKETAASVDTDDETDEDMTSNEGIDKAVTKYMEKNKMTAGQYAEALSLVKGAAAQKELDKKIKENGGK